MAAKRRRRPVNCKALGMAVDDDDIGTPADPVVALAMYPDPDGDEDPAAMMWFPLDRAEEVGRGMLVAAAEAREVQKQAARAAAEEGK